MKKPVKYVADCDHVKEVSLHGVADLHYWRQELAKQRLEPVEIDGKAQVLVIGGNMKYWGVDFTEVSFSVAVKPHTEGPGEQAALLMQAFNSSSLFAFCERVFFATPYRQAECRLSVEAPVFIRILDGSQIVFEAEMNNRDRDDNLFDAGDGDEWSGEIFLPAPNERNGAKRKSYFAKLSGGSKRVPFITGLDSIRIEPTITSNSLECLVDSGFSPTMWQVRSDGRHARSKTYKTASA